MAARVKFPNKVWALFLTLWTVVGTLVMGLTSVQFFPSGYEIFALIGLTVVTTVCVSRLFSPSLLLAFFWATATPPVTSGISAGLYVIFVPPGPEPFQYFGDGLPAALFDGVLMAFITLPVGGICAGVCVGILSALDRSKRSRDNQ